MNDSEVKTRINQVIEDRISNGNACPASWIVMAVMRLFPGIEGEDSDFYILCAHGHVTALVGKVLREIRLSEENPQAPEQDVLPGFQRLQRRYRISRDKESVVVSLLAMTRHEVLAKADELDSFAAGAKIHANELRRWADNMIEEETN